MQSKTLLRFSALLMPVALLFGTGCAHVNNPWQDSSAVINAELTTSSAKGYAQNNAEFGRQQQRSWERSEVRVENGATSHWPLWFEDPFEDKGNRLPGEGGPEASGDRDAPDNVFAWNWADYFAMPYSPARMFFLNTVLWPVSAIVTPPGTLMESDGRISKGLLWYDHDATRSNSVNREPPDVNVITKRSTIEHDEVPEVPSEG